MANVIVIGASGHAKVVIDVLASSDQRVVGLVDRDKPIGSTHFGHPILGIEANLPSLLARYDAMPIVAIGDNWVRSQVVARVRALVPEVTFAKAVHPNACIANGAVVGEGTVVMAGAVVNPDTRIGAHCIVNTKASIDHDGEMNDFSSIAPGATLGGSVRVGAFAAISLGASVIHGRSIGEHVVVGAGAVVIDDIPARSVAYGVPARVVRARAPGDRYL
jgi:sugar O-acyltransferase (sialic acid O-acetyltransferase NeuD family)